MHKFTWGPGALIHLAPDTGGKDGQEPVTETPTRTPLTPLEGGDSSLPLGRAREGAAPGAQTPQAGNIEELPGWAQTLVKELRGENASHRKAKTLAEQAKDEAQAKALAEQGKFKELYEQAQAAAAASQQLIRAMELDALRSTIGRKLGLPDALHGRLKGEDEAAIEADAQALAQALPVGTPNGQQPAGIRFPVQGTGGGSQHKAQDLVGTFVQEQNDKAKAVNNPLIRS